MHSNADLVFPASENSALASAESQARILFPAFVVHRNNAGRALVHLVRPGYHGLRKKIFHHAPCFRRAFGLHGYSFTRTTQRKGDAVGTGKGAAGQEDQQDGGGGQHGLYYLHG